MRANTFAVATPRSHTIRVAIADLRRPLDPALASGRDEETLARMLYSTPLRTDDHARVVPGLCTDWNAADGFRVWRFHCSDAPQIAAELRRVARLRASPAQWIFAAAQRIAAPTPRTLFLRLASPWRRFPYALTVIAAAPHGVPGPFRLVRGSSTRIVLRRNGVTLIFRHLYGLAALRAFKHGEVDEAPVLLGDIGNFGSQPQLLHVRPLLALDAVRFRDTRIPPDVRRAYWQTADRADYQTLIPERHAAAALGITETARRANPAAFRRAMHSIPSLPPLSVRIAVPADPTMRYGARILYAQWRELGLGPTLVSAGQPADADFVRASAAYPQQEALLGALHVPTALGEDDQRAAFATLDAQLRTNATLIPICWVADARLVSPALVGWRENVLGNVDYTRVRVR
jgi:hypothetical protein